MLEAKDIESCKLCGDLPKLKEVLVQNGKSKILVLGESPAKDGWIVSHRAFYNNKGELQASGKVLNKLLNLIGLTIDDISFTEACKCVITDRKMLKQCVINCRSFLLRQLEEIDCDIILPMGQYPTSAILDREVKRLKDFVGKRFEIKICGKIKTVIPIYHTSPINPLSYKGNEKIFKELIC